MKTKTYRNVLSASTLARDVVVNREGEKIGNVEEIMLDVHEGRVAYAVLSFGGFLGIGDKLFAIPWRALTVDEENKQFILNIDKETLKRAPGFDKSHWPDFTADDWRSDIHSFYGIAPYWEE